MPVRLKPVAPRCGSLLLPGLTAALVDMLPLGLGRPFQSTNNTGEFRLMGSVSLRQSGEGSSLKSERIKKESEQSGFHLGNLRE